MSIWRDSTWKQLERFKFAEQLRFLAKEIEAGHVTECVTVVNKPAHDGLAAVCAWHTFPGDGFHPYILLQLERLKARWLTREETDNE